MLLTKLVENNIIYILSHRVAVLQLKLQTAEGRKVAKNHFSLFRRVKLFFALQRKHKSCREEKTYKMYLHFISYVELLHF